MASYFVAVVAAFACLNAVAANPKGYPAYKAAGCPKPPLPVPETVVLTQVAPAPFTYGPQGPAVIEHVSAPYEINYFGKPYVIKHVKSAALNVLTQTPVVVDEYAAPAVNEIAAGSPGGPPPAVIVEEVCPPVAAPAYAPAPVYAPAPAYAPAPVYAAPAPAPCH